MAEKPKTPASIIASLPKPVEPSGRNRLDDIDELATANCQIKQIGRENFRIVARGHELDMRIYTREKAIQMRDIIERGIILKASCERQGVLWREVNSCKVNPTQTVFHGLSLQISNGAGVINDNIVTEEQFRSALARVTKKRLTNGTEHLVDVATIKMNDGDTQLYSLLEAFENYINTVTEWGTVASQIASRQ